jgi:hypothetical protein
MCLAHVWSKILSLASEYAFSLEVECDVAKKQIRCDGGSIPPRRNIFYFFRLISPKKMFENGFVQLNFSDKQFIQNSNNQLTQNNDMNMEFFKKMFFFTNQ